MADRGVVGWLALGLLLDGEASGYELWQRAERSVAHFWPVTRSALYAELPRLAERGLATAQEVPQRDYPDKRVYTATAAGREAFTAWLAAADLAERPRHPQQLLLFFAAHATPAQTRLLLEGWRTRARASADHCRDLLAGKGVDPDAAGSLPRDPRLLTALFGLRRAQTDLAFLDEAGEVLLEADEDGGERASDARRKFRSS